MIKKIVVIMLLAFVPMITFAQASGGQITRKPQKAQVIQQRASKSKIVKPNAIDLGLPSGTLWADRNVGASSPNDFGGLYRYGAPKTKMDGSNFEISSLNNIVGTSDDVAMTVLGSEWRTPSSSQAEELIKYCKITREVYNGVQVAKFVGPNGNSIILPLAGVMYNYGRSQAGDFGDYMLGEKSRFLNVYIGGSVEVTNYGAGSSGESVRAVLYDPNNNRRIEEIKRKQVEEEQAAKQKKYAEDVIKKLLQKMVLVESGTYEMGCRKGEADAVGALPKMEKRFYKDALPSHMVVLSPFYISSTQVTQQEWNLLMEDNPSVKKEPSRPVNCITWNEAMEFVRRLNSLTGMNFRLPTEAEWEFAARGGTKSRGYIYSGSYNLSSVSYRASGYGDSNLFCKVGSFHPNELGLYDMTGNGLEWCNDWYGSYSSNKQSNPMGPTEGVDKVCRGISAASVDDRIFSRHHMTPDSRYYVTFRLAHDVNK